MFYEARSFDGRLPWNTTSLEQMEVRKCRVGSFVYMLWLHFLRVPNHYFV